MFKIGKKMFFGKPGYAGIRDTPNFPRDPQDIRISDRKTGKTVKIFCLKDTFLLSLFRY